MYNAVVNYSIMNEVMKKLFVSIIILKNNFIASSHFERMD